MVGDTHDLIDQLESSNPPSGLKGGIKFDLDCFPHRINFFFSIAFFFVTQTEKKLVSCHKPFGQECGKRRSPRTSTRRSRRFNYLHDLLPPRGFQLELDNFSAVVAL